MDGFLIEALALISALTGLTVEGLKKLLDERGKQYKSTALAVYTAFTITVIGSILYIIYNAIPVTPQIIVVIIAMAFLSFLCATVGYDKVVKVIGGKNDQSK